MINAIIRFSISHRLIVMLLVAILVAAGWYSLRRLPIDAVPDVTNVQVQVLTAAPSLAPLEIERQITFPVEVAMSGSARHSGDSISLKVWSVGRDDRVRRFGRYLFCPSTGA